VVTVYCVFDAKEGGSSYFATLREARAALSDFSEGSEIERLTLVSLPPRRLAVLLLNGQGFVARREKV